MTSSSSQRDHPLFSNKTDDLRFLFETMDRPFTTAASPRDPAGQNPSRHLRFVREHDNGPCRSENQHEAESIKSIPTFHPKHFWGRVFDPSLATDPWRCKRTERRWPLAIVVVQSHARLRANQLLDCHCCFLESKLPSWPSRRLQPIRIPY